MPDPLAPDPAWVAVDDYLNPLYAPADDALSAALAASREAGLPEIAVSPIQGKLLQVLARSLRARSVLEIGTLGAYSTIWLARALGANGRVVTLEADPRHAAVARANLAAAGLTGVVELIEGPALDSLPALEASGEGPFDLVFIDANKDQIPEYFDWALRLTLPGSLILVDNVVRQGGVADPASDDPAVVACRVLHQRLATEPRVSATVVQTVGSKGHDGLLLATVLN